MTSISDPLTLPCGVVLPNRIAKAAMSEQLADRNNAPDRRLRNLYTRWSNSGAALLITGNVMVTPTAVSEPRQVVLDDECHLPAFNSWANAATANGTQAWMQINHAGRQIPRFLALHPKAPSAVTVSTGLGLFGTPRELSHTEINDLVGQYAATAALAIQTGFTGIEIHAAHGYLISQFLSPATNTRTDCWGGCPEHRRRFLIAVVEAVRAAIGPNAPLAVKLNSADFQRGGFTAAESLETIDVLAASGVDLLEISGGTFESAAMVDRNTSRYDQAPGLAKRTSSPSPSERDHGCRCH
jgi:2,4-dienoyl-CoA reductase-like NADH-dependent reductase (Old Yellow Enzyme family)